MHDRDQPAACDVCGAALGPGGAERCAGVWLCRECHLGRPGPRLEARHIGLQSIDYTAGPRLAGSRHHRDYVLVTASVPYDLGVQASCSCEGAVEKLSKLFWSELQVGDPLFDRDVLVRTTTRARTAELLQHERLQAAIHHAVTELQGSELPLRFENDRVRIHGALQGAAGRGSDLRRIGILLAHGMSAFARASGLQPRAELVPPPDLDYVAARLTPPLLALGVWGGTLADLNVVVDFVTSQKEPRELASLGVGLLRLRDPRLAPLRRLTWLRSLTLLGLSDVTAVEPLATLRSLTALDLSDCPVVDLDPVAELDQLESLVLLRTGVRSVAPLAKLGRLRRLSLKQTAVCDLSPLHDASALEELDLRSTAVADLTPVLRCQRLKRVLTAGSQVPPQQLEALRRAVPDVCAE